MIFPPEISNGCILAAMMRTAALIYAKQRSVRWPKGDIGFSYFMTIIAGSWLIYYITKIFIMLQYFLSTNFGAFKKKTKTSHPGLTLTCDPESEMALIIPQLIRSHFPDGPWQQNINRAVTPSSSHAGSIPAFLWCGQEYCGKELWEIFFQMEIFQHTYKYL